MTKKYEGTTIWIPGVKLIKVLDERRINVGLRKESYAEMLCRELGIDIEKMRGA